MMNRSSGYPWNGYFKRLGIDLGIAYGFIGGATQFSASMGAFVEWLRAHELMNLVPITVFAFARYILYDRSLHEDRRHLLGRLSAASFKRIDNQPSRPLPPPKKGRKAAGNKSRLGAVSPKVQKP